MNNSLSGPIPPWGPQDGLRSLLLLYLQNNFLSSTVPTALNSLSSLKAV